MSLESELITDLNKQGTDFVRFVDISRISASQNKGYPAAVLLGITLSPEYLLKISETTDYVNNMIRNKQVNEDEFHLKEIKADYIADYIAGDLTAKGYSAYSQSENNLSVTGFFDERTKSTPLPHKTIAGMAGLGWIGKHNLLITPEFGSAICMCTVLTDAPLSTVLESPLSSRCGSCSICTYVCPVNAIKGKVWSTSASRDEMVDVYKCKTCLECLVHCPWTQSYMKKR